MRRMAKVLKVIGAERTLHEREEYSCRDNETWGTNNKATMWKSNWSGGYAPERESGVISRGHLCGI